MKNRKLITLIVAVAVCLMLGTPAFGACPPELVPFGLCGEAPTLDAITMPSTAPYYPGLEPPCEMIADATIIWFETTPQTIMSLLPPDSAYFPPAVFLRNYFGYPAEVFQAFCESQGGSIIPGWEECMIQPFGQKLMMALALVDYKDTSCYGPYREVIFTIPTIVVDPEKGSIPYSPDPRYWQYHYDLSPAVGFPGDYHVGLYVPYLWLSSDGPIAAGRETWGYPKKMADISYKDDSKKGSRIWKVERSLGPASPIFGHVGGDHLPILHNETQQAAIIKAWVQPDTSTPRHPDEVRFPPLYVNKIIPNVKGNAADINQLNLVPMDPQTSAGTPGYADFVTFGNAGIEIIGGPDDPINQIDVVQVYGGYQFSYNFYLSAGRTLIDYLAQ